MLNNFIHAKTKSLFLEYLGTGNLPDEAIGFIEDSKEIWNRGVFYGRADNIITSGDGTKFLADDGSYKEIEIPQTNVYTCAIDTDHHTHYNDLLEAVNRGDQIFIKTAGLTAPYVCIPMYEESTNSGSILCYPHPIALKQNSDIGFGGSIITVNSGGFCEYDNLELIIKNSGDGTQFLSDDGTYKTLNTNPFVIVPNGVLPESGESGKIYLTPASLVGDQNVMIEYVWVNNAWEKFGEFATNIDLSNYALKSEVVTKISDLESKLTAALERIATLESELENTLKV